MAKHSNPYLEQSQWERLIAAERTLRLKGVRDGIRDLFEKFIADVEREGEPKPVAKSLAKMIKAGRYSSVHSYINSENFKVDPARFTTANTKVYHFNKRMSSEAAAIKMAKDGYEPAFIENLLAYGAENPEEQLEHQIVALGSSCDCSGDACSPCLDRSDDGRVLTLYWRNCNWREVFRFLAVRKSAL